MPHVFDVSSARSRRQLIAAITLLCLAGCGSPYGATVHGIVTLDGTTMTHGGVQFHPIGEGATAYGNFSVDGNYQLGTGSESGITPGKYKVTVMATEPPPTNLPVGVAPPIAKRLSPERYGTVEQTPFEFEVIEGDNTIDLAMTSK